MDNAWLIHNSRLLSALKKKLVEAEYTPELHNFPIKATQLLLNGAEAEIIRLQKLVDEIPKEKK